MDPRDHSASPGPDDGSIATEVRVHPTAGMPELEVTYDGRTPPLELFSRWTDLGWEPPTPAMPPRDAIDWSRADAGSGRRYTLRPFRAVGRATLARRGPQPSLAVDDALEAARALGYDVGADGDDAGPTATPTGFDRELVRVTTTQPTHAGPELEALARRHGAQVQSHQMLTTREVSYRGSTNTVSSMVIEMEIVVARSALPTIVELADAFGVTPTVVTDASGAAARTGA